MLTGTDTDQFACRNHRPAPIASHFSLALVQVARTSNAHIPGYVDKTVPERGCLLEDSSGGKLSHEMAGGGNHRFPYAQQVSDLLSEKRLDDIAKRAEQLMTFKSTFEKCVKKLDFDN